MKIEIWKTCNHDYKLDSFPVFGACLMRSEIIQIDAFKIFIL